METTVRIDGRDVKFKATAAVPLLYRRKFNRDLFRDIRDVATVMKGKKDTGSDLPVHTLEIFENLAYIMSKHAEPDTVSDSPEEWLDGFSMMPIVAIFPVILDLWSGNMDGLEESKKKAEQLIENLQRLSFSSAPSSSGFPSGTSIS